MRITMAIATAIALTGLATELPAQSELTSTSFILRAPTLSGGAQLDMSPAAPGSIGTLSGTIGQSSPLGELTGFTTLTMLSSGFWPIAARGGAPCTDPLDVDCDGLGNGVDLCPFYASPDQTDTDGNGIGDVCECGDQNGDGLVNVEDILAINASIFDLEPASPLCDTNNDGACNVSDILGVNARIFGADAFCARNPPDPLP